MANNKILLNLAHLALLLIIGLTSFSQTYTAPPILHTNSLTFAQGGYIDNVSVARPVGVQTGDMILIGVFSSDATPALLTGFTSIVSGGAVDGLRYMYKIATASEPANYTVTATGSTRLSAFAVRITRFNTTTPIGNSSTINSAGAAGIIPSVNTTINSSLLIAGTSLSTEIGEPSAPSGMTALHTQNQGMMVYQYIAVAGATGTRQFNLQSSTSNRAAMFVVNGNNAVTESCTATLLLSSTTASNTTSGQAATVKLAGTNTNLPLGLYTVTYNTTGANTNTGLTASVFINSTNTGSFTIPGANLPNVGSNIVTITNLRLQPSLCAGNTQSISANNIDTFNTTCYNVTLFDVNYGTDFPLNFKPTPIVARIHGNPLPNGTYTVSYDIIGPVNNTGLTATMTVINGRGSFNLNPAHFSAIGYYTLKITNLSRASGCSSPVGGFSSTYIAVTDIDNPTTSCGYNSKGCTNTNNAFIQSWADPTTIEYDNFVSCYHATTVRTTNGILKYGDQKCKMTEQATCYRPRL